MRIKKFHGRNMRDSLEQMRNELGEEAIILSSREILEPGSLPVTEVVAGIEPEELELHRQQRRVPSDIAFAAGERRNPLFATSVTKNPDAPAQAPQTQLRTRYSASVPADTQSIQSEIASLRKAIENLSTVQSSQQRNFTPPAFLVLQSELLEAGFSETHCNELLSYLHKQGIEAQVDILRQALRSHLCSSLRTSNPLRPSSQPKIVIVSGAPGSGKSSLCAKLSASFALTMNSNALILQPSSAHAQLPDNVQSVRLESYSSNQQLLELMQNTDDQDFVFIEVQLDSANSESAARIEQLRSATNADTVLLTVSAVCNDKTAHEWMRMASALPECALVLTQVDCSRLQGTCLQALHTYNVPVSFLTDGRGIPQSIKAATPERIVDSVFQPQITRSA